MKNIDISELWNPRLNEVYNEIAPFIIGKNHRGDIPPTKINEVFCRGGRSSGKSYGISAWIWLALENDPKKNAVVVRKVGSSIRKSCWEQMEKLRKRLGLTDWKPNPTQLIMKNTKTGQKIYFLGLDDEEKVRSITVDTGYLSIVWFEEAKQFDNYEEILQAKASILRGGFDDDDEENQSEESDAEFMTFLSYNPPKSGFEWINVEAQKKVKGRIVNASTYLTMPEKWIGKNIIAEANRLKESDYQKYEYIYLGKPVGVEQQFFTNITIRKITDEEIAKMKWFDYGIDWGDIDPNVFGKVYLHDGRLWIIDGIWQEGKQKNKIYKFGEEVKKKMLKDWGSCIWADAQNKTAANVLNMEYDLNVKDFTPKQGRNGRTEGGNFLKSLTEIIIDPERTPELAENLVKFEHMEAPGGKGFLDEPSRFHDHGFDMLRYALNRQIARADIDKQYKAMGDMFKEINIDDGTMDDFQVDDDWCGFDDSEDFMI